MRTTFSFSGLFLLALVAFPALGQPDDETAAKAAEQAGKYQVALQQYTAALAKVKEGSADDQRLREAIIKLAQRLSSSPAVPDEARRFSVRGRIAIKEAKSLLDFEEAAKEFGKALRVAPWWADSYFNQGVALEKAGKFNEAIRSLKFYLLAAPNNPDAQKVKDQIFALEYRQEKMQKDAVALKALDREKDRQRQAENFLASLKGFWRTEICLQSQYRSLGDAMSQSARNRQLVAAMGCTIAELRGLNWHAMPADQLFSIKENGTVVIDNPGFWHVGRLIGIPEGPRLADIRWKCDLGTGEEKEAWSTWDQKRPDSAIYITCDFGPSGGEDAESRRYKYYYFRKL